MIRRLHILNSPFFLAALTLLALNDFLLKHLYPGWITGKLSDFAGLFVLALFLRALSGRKWLAVTITALSFVWWKLDWSQGFIDWWNAWTALPLSRVVDPTDLIALAVLPLAFLYRPRITVFSGRQAQMGIAVLSVLLMFASSSDDIRFMHAMEGETPSELDGCKVTVTRSGQSDQNYHFHQYGGNNFAVVKGKRDTVFRGDIVRYEDMYFVNRTHPLYPEDYYVIQAFEITNDSIRNFQSIFSKRPYALLNTDNIEKKRYFNDVNIIWSEANEQNIILINNQEEETYEAFKVLLEHADWHTAQLAQ